MSVNAANCPLCKSTEALKLGVRGNREYLGANNAATPHLVTNVLKCSSCEFIYCHPSIAGAESLERLHYDNVNYRVFSSEEEELEPYLYGFKIILRYKRGVSLLDVGAGKGEAVYLASKLGFKASGIEPSVQACSYASQRFGISIYNGFYENFSSDMSEKFQVITMFHVLEHVQEPRLLLNSLKDRMDPEGVLYIEVPNGNARLLRLADTFFSLVGKPWSTRLSPVHPPFHKVAYTPRALRFLLESEGFLVFYSDTYSPGSRCRREMSTKRKAIMRNVISWILTLFPDQEVIRVMAKVDR